MTQRSAEKNRQSFFDRSVGDRLQHRSFVAVGQGLRLAAEGLGIVIALFVTRQLSSLPFGVSAYDPITFVGVTLLLVTVALLACYSPARRATAVDPLVALRHE